MDSTKKKPQVVHHLAYRKSKAIRKRTTSLGCEEKEKINIKFEVDSGFKQPLYVLSKPHRPLSASFGCQSISDSDSQSDNGSGRFQTHSSHGTCAQTKCEHPGCQSDDHRIPLHNVPRLLPPIGVFWDIENCQVPKGRSAVAVSQAIRKRFFTGFREAEFLVVCDVKKENNQILQELNDAQVNLIHVASMCKNAADEKLRQSMRRFADLHGSPATIILISGDINFAADITDLRHRKQISIILLTQSNVSENLILCANEHYSFTDLVEALPLRGAVKLSNQPVEVIVHNLPGDKDSTSLKNRLKQLSDNCGGRVTSMRQTCATIRFSSYDVACRAQKRMDGEDVFGNKIHVSGPVRLSERERWDMSPQKYYNGNIAGKKYVSVHSRDCASSNWADFMVPTSGLYHSTPAALNMLGSSMRPGMGQNPFVGSWNTYSSASVSIGHDYYPVSYSGYHTPPVDMINSGRDSRNQSPFSVGLWNASYPTKSPTNEVLTKAANAVSEKTPKGFRRIRGTHKAPAEGAADHRNATPSSSSLNGRDLSPYMVSGDEAARPPKWGACGSRTSSRSSRTPTPVPLQYDGDLDEPENFFQPISTSSSQTNGTNSSEPVELHVSNLDQTVGAREMKKILLNTFKEHVMVLSLMVLNQPDGCLNALVKLASQQDAQYAISKLQRRKIGHKRINISRASSSGPSPQVIRSQVLSLLSEVPNHSLPLFKFCELYESRFLCSISISDISKVKECQVTDGPRGRLVSLQVDARNSPSPQLTALQEGEQLEQPFCPIHGQKVQPNRGWAEPEVLPLPSIIISLKLLAIRMHSLLQSHNGSVHLNSLTQCYEAQFEPLNDDKDGVALEHLVSCLPGIEIYISPANIKYLRWSKAQPASNGCSKGEDETSKNVNTPLAGQLAVFSRELVDLLKTSPRCQISFNKFIPAYHHHFGRQCRVADYGFTKLIELLESVPHIVQVIGEGNRRMVTLTHRIQMRRFMADLLRVLRAQANKQVLLSQLATSYEEVFSKPFIIIDYGVCEVRDLLSDLTDAPVVMTPINDSEEEFLIAVPKREQTSEEKEKTKQFAGEVVELLRHVPNCSMRFNKFIPAHHIHFGWQCRVSDYGFTKLIELFEAIPDIVQIDNIDGERWVTLMQPERLKVLADQIVVLVQNSRDARLTEQMLLNNYRLQFGYSLRPESFNCTDFEELMNLLPDTVKVTSSSSGLVVTVLDNMKTKRVQNILSSEPDCSISFDNLSRKFRHLHSQSLDLDEVKVMKEIEVIGVSGPEITVRLAPLLCFMSEIKKLVQEAGGRLPLSTVEGRYLQSYGRWCQPEKMGYSSLGALLQALPGVVRLRGRGARRYVVLADTPSPPAGVNQSVLDITVLPGGEEENLPNGDAESGHFSSTSAQDVDSSTSSDLKATGRSSTSEMFSDLSDPSSGCDPVGHSKVTTPGRGPWSQRIQSRLTVTSSPAAMLSPSSNLLPAYPAPELSSSSSTLTTSPLVPQYSYNPFPSGPVAPEPSCLPWPQLFASSAPTESEISGDGSSNSSTPCRSKVKRRLAAHFNNPLDLP